MNYNYCKLAEQYIHDVSKGKIITGEKARLAVERHLNDLKTAKEKGWKFSKTHAEIALFFVCQMRHTKTHWAKKPFNLTPYQAFIIYCLFGWLLENGNRRFSKAYIRTPRKWGKSELAAAVGLYMLFADGEPGAEIYSAATTFSQARKVFDPAAAMCRMAKKDDPDIRKSTKVFDSANNCIILFNDGEINNIFRPLSKDSKSSEEGSNPHCGIVDEYHLHPTTEMLDMLETGTGTRRNSLIFIITTPGFDLSYPCYEYDKICVQILKGNIEVDRTFVMIFDMDDGDDWQDETNWVKANPQMSYGLIQIEDLRDGLQKARAEGFSKERAFRVKNLGQWLASQAGWIPEEYYQNAKVHFTLDDMQGQKCYGGLDFARVSDLNSAAFLFPPTAEHPKFRLIFRTYCDEETINDPKKNEGHEAYARWAQAGHLIKTEGNAADWEYIVDDCLSIAHDTGMEVMGYDRRFALMPVTKMVESGIEMIGVSQMFDGMTVPILQYELLFRKGMIEVQDSPVAEWGMGNIVLVNGEGDMVRFSKKNSTGKIDMWSAAIDAMNVFCQKNNINENSSIWDYITENMLLT